jgi:hypothetical protein
MTNQDWKKSEDYPPVKGTSPERWAYEFLIRNQNFVEEFESAKKETINPGGRLIGWNETPVGKVLKRYGIDYPMLPGWLEKTGSDSPLIFEKHPRHVPSYKVEKSGGLFNEHAVGKRYHVSLEMPQRTVFEFDLTSPISPQIARAKKMLISNQKTLSGEKRSSGKSIVRLYPWYLRVLDAYSAGIHAPKICEVLGGQYKQALGEDDIRNWKLAAERLRDGGYRDIVRNPKP